MTFTRLQEVCLPSLMLQGRKTFSFLPASFFVWPNNYIAIRQINKSKTNLILHVWEPIKLGDSKNDQKRQLLYLLDKEQNICEEPTRQGSLGLGSKLVK